MVQPALANWNLQETWNGVVTPERPPKKRDYIRASDLGKPFLDRWLDMKGVAPTNHYPPRIKRIFDAGNIFEEVVERVFRLCGILVDAQANIRVEEPGMLPVIGRFDHKVGGHVQIERVRKFSDPQILQKVIDSVTLIDPDVADYLKFVYPTEWILNRTLKMAEQLYSEYPDGMKTLIAEIKSVNSMAFWAHKNIDPATGFFKGYDAHKLQLFTYLKGTGEEEGRRFYVSKDDLTLMESPLHVNSIITEELWREDVSKMTDYYKQDKEPPREDDIIWDDEKQVYTLNWAIERSRFFTRITGFATVEGWAASLKEELKKKNTKACAGCGKEFTLTTLNKNNGYCGRCTKEGKGVKK